jgi:hypothetical protein
LRKALGDLYEGRNMRRQWLVPALVVLSAALLASSASAIGSPRTFSLLEVSTPTSDQPMGDFTFDRPPVGGDQFAVTNELYAWAGTKKGARVGRDEVVLTFVTGFGSDFSKKAIVLFVAQVYLPGGSILVEGYGRVNPNGPSKYTFPVVGGTGSYAGVGGYVIVRDLGNGQTNRTNLQFHLQP